MIAASHVNRNLITTLILLKQPLSGPSVRAENSSHSGSLDIQLILDQ